MNVDRHLRLVLGKIGATARVTYYGNVTQPGSVISTATVLSIDVENGRPVSAGSNE